MTKILIVVVCTHRVPKEHSEIMKRIGLHIAKNIGLKIIEPRNICDQTKKRRVIACEFLLLSGNSRLQDDIPYNLTTRNRSRIVMNAIRFMKLAGCWLDAGWLLAGCWLAG